MTIVWRMILFAIHVFVGLASTIHIVYPLVRVYNLIATLACFTRHLLGSISGHYCWVAHCTRKHCATYFTRKWLCSHKVMFGIHLTRLIVMFVTCTIRYDFSHFDNFLVDLLLDYM